MAKSKPNFKSKSTSKPKSAKPPKPKAKTKPIFVYAKLNARVMPMTRGDQFEDPLADALEQAGLGAVTGGGTMQSVDGEIDYCGIDLELVNLEKAVPFVCKLLAKMGAPSGSKLQYTVNKRQVEVSFGEAQGLAIYLNGTDLPATVYKECDINDIIKTIKKLLGKAGSLLGYWQGPKETALYFYGSSFETMKKRIAAFVAENPLCQKSRLVRIA